MRKFWRIYRMLWIVCAVGLAVFHIFVWMFPLVATEHLFQADPTILREHAELAKEEVRKFVLIFAMLFVGLLIPFMPDFRGKPSPEIQVKFKQE